MTRREIPISDGSEEKMASQKNAGEDAAGDTGVEDQSATIAMLEDRISTLEGENEGLRDQRLRAIAELDNARRRADQDVMNTVRYASADVLKKILPIVDDFVRSVDSGAENKDFNSFYEGIVLIKNKLMKLLDDEGVKRIEAVGTPFNVEFHEALMRQPSDQPEDTVVTELEPGYIYKDKVIRHAKVIVSAGS